MKTVRSVFFAAAPVAVALIALTAPPVAAGPGTAGNGRIAYTEIHEDDPFINIATMNADGSELDIAQAGPDTQNLDPTWSPDGTELAFYGEPFAGSTFPDHNLFIANADGTNPQKVLNSRARDYDWSPSGARFAAVGTLSGADEGEVFTFKRDGTDHRQITSDGQQKSDPEWSPDGSMIAYTKGFDTGDVFYVDDFLGIPFNLTNNPADDEMGSWSPDGSKIVFASNRSGNYELYTLTLDNPSTTVVRLTTTAAQERYPAWSPDGTKIAYSRAEAHAEGVQVFFHIWTLNASNGSSQTRLTNTDRISDWDAQWAPALCNGVKATVWGTGAGETIHGTAGDDVIAGLEGNDTIDGGGGQDLICGGQGNDRIVNGSGADIVSGGGGTDTADYSARTNRVVINLNFGDNTFDGEPGEGDNVMTDVENAIGGSANDFLAGSSAANVLTGNGGNDSITGGPGNDTINGGTGADVIDGGSDTDTVTYAGRATVEVTIDGTANDGNSGDGNQDNVQTTVENVIGGVGNDTLAGSSAANFLSGGDGNDTLDGGSGADRFSGGNGTDTVTYANRGSVNVSLDGVANDGNSGDGASATARDSVSTSVENLIGGDGNDTLKGSSRANRLTGGLGADRLFGLGGSDALIARDGVKDTSLDGGTGTDTGTFDSIDPARVSVP